MDITQMKLPRLGMCCFCVPLDSGFLVWGYVKLVYSVILALTLFIAAMIFILFRVGGVIAPLEIIMLLPVLLLIICIYSLIIVIAGHLNNIKLLKTTFIIGAILLIFEILYSPCLGYRMIIYNSKEDGQPLYIGLWAIPVILEPFLQGYVLLLIRSKMLKLQEESRSVKSESINLRHA